MVAERWSAAPESLSDESENVEEMKSAAPAAIDAAGDVAGCVAGWNGDETKIEAEVLVQQIAGVTDAIEDKDQLSKTDARVECVVEEIIDDHVLRVTDNAVEGVKCSAQDSDELIPEWLSFVKGVVDSEDPPLNIYRETLPENKILRVIKKHVTKCLEMLAEIAELNDAYKEFYEQSVKCMKLGIDEDSIVGVKTAEVLRFNTSKPGDEQDNSEEHVDRTKEGQNDMCYVTDESIAVVSSLFEENLRKKGHEVLYMVNPMDEYAVHQFNESDGKKLKSPTKEGLNLGDEDEEKMLEELKAKLEPSTKLMKDVLGDKVEMVIASDRIVDSPCVLTTSEYGWSAKMERIMEAQALRDNSMTSHMVSKKTIEVNPTHSIMMKLMKKASAWQQQHKSSKHQLTKQSTRQERGGERKKEGNREGKRGRSEQEEGRDQEERKEEERKSEVKKDVTGWTVVTRNRRPRKMVQIFVKVNGSKATPMDVNLTDDKVEDVIRRIQNDEDVYVTMHGRVLKRGEKLKSYEVTDGCTIQVTSRLRGGGKHKDKKSKADTKRNVEESGKKDQLVGSMSDKCQEMTKDQKDALIQTIERNEGYRKLITTISEAENWEHEIQCFRKQLQEQSGIEEERAKVMEWGMRWAVEARRRGRGAEQEQRRQEEERQRRHEEQGENTGRGSAGLVRGGDERCQTDETSRKGKGKGNGGKGEHDGKAGGAGSKGRRQVENLVMDEGQENMRAKTSEENHEEDMRKLLEMVEREEMELEMMQQEEMEHEEQRGRVAPNMGAGGSHPQATSDTGKKKVLRWADCNDEEGKENEEEVEEEKEAEQWEKTEERPPGLEEVESKQEARKEQEAERKQEQEQEQEEDRERKAEEKKEQEQEKRAQEAQEAREEAEESAGGARGAEESAGGARGTKGAGGAREERRAQEARELKKAQEAREEERRAQEAHEEQRRAQKALEQRKAQEEQEREAKAQEERKKEVRAQEERERLARGAKAREERERERSSGGARKRSECSRRAKRARGSEAEGPGGA